MVAVPMLVIGVGLGLLASQLGAVTVSAVPGSQSADVGGLQNTATNLGTSLGTALIGSVLIASLSSSVVEGLRNDPEVSFTAPARARFTRRNPGFRKTSTIAPADSLIRPLTPPRPLDTPDRRVAAPAQGGDRGSDVVRSAPAVGLGSQRCGPGGPP